MSASLDATRQELDELRSLAEGLEGPARAGADRLVARLDEAARRVESALRRIEASEESPAAPAAPPPVLSRRARRGLRKRVRAERAAARAAAEAAARKGTEPALGHAAPAASGAPLAGHTSSFAVAEVLGFLASLGKSGTLHVVAAEERFQIELRGGEVVYAHGNSPPAELRLGEILVMQGALERDRLDGILSERGVSMLGRSLLDCGTVSPEELRLALGFQAQHVFHRLYSTTGARFEFREGEHVEKSDDIQLNVTHLLLESARTLDERENRLNAALTPLEG